MKVIRQKTFSIFSVTSSRFPQLYIPLTKRQRRYKKLWKQAIKEGQFPMGIGIGKALKRYSIKRQLWKMSKRRD